MLFRHPLLDALEDLSRGKAAALLRIRRSRGRGARVTIL
jgi:hypothetical protein